ncbi:Sensor histidine kinase YpdA [Lacunisphaera limnophila]|uniref:Sensor histidine kinase YpdA n=1 Tax=Lacunisphaera limnophila TaxID=1838286 RepID=A0A1D8ASN8_9BACT|nr:sensor histidine kinase [Lacunisphaera limnophila]AOS43882.1 Sensor histidine kinase YpdA [Lacunisphaera limnophila]
MSVTRTISARYARPVGLAAGPVPVVRSRAMTADPEAKLERAKHRLYVLCQAAGWGGLLAMQLFYQDAVDKQSDTPLHDRAILVMIILQGLLLTHYVRALIRRWGWLQLGWAPLVPRLLGLAALMSLAWSVVGYGYIYGVLDEPWTSSQITLRLGFVASTINGVLLFCGWFSLYFIYHVFERLRRMQLEQLRLATSAKEAELRALKSQVNPHFLFNSLNSLRALIDEDAPRARESVTRLANMLRYSLQSGQQETVPLEEEVRIVEDYLALEMIRHEARLRVRWAVSETVRHLPVPPMLLQTLVENAVKYGISVRREGGEITITAALEGDDLHIRVSNPGDLAGPVSAPAAMAGSSTGVGLRNASERLQLLFGDRARLSLSAGPAGCVTAHVLIPGRPATAKGNR